MWGNLKRNYPKHCGRSFHGKRKWIYILKHRQVHYDVNSLIRLKSRSCKGHITFYKVNEILLGVKYIPKERIVIIIYTGKTRYVPTF